MKIKLSTVFKWLFSRVNLKRVGLLATGFVLATLIFWMDISLHISKASHSEMRLISNLGILIAQTNQLSRVRESDIHEMGRIYQLSSEKVLDIYRESAKDIVSNAKDDEIEAIRKLNVSDYPCFMFEEAGTGKRILMPAAKKTSFLFYGNSKTFETMSEH